MTLVEKHSHTTAWWTATVGNFTVSMQRNYVTIFEKCPPDSLCSERTSTISLKNWPAIRDAIDALYTVWQEQQGA